MSPSAFQSSDITTDPEQATSGSSALSKYMQKMQQNSDQFMEKLYTNTIDRPCLSACEHNEAMEYFMSCRQPLSFLPFVTKEVDSGNGIIEYEMPLPGAYEVPTTCEYCGSDHVSNCAPDCQRPKLFFAKQRPPFVPVGGSSNGRCSTVKWDAVTDYEQVKETAPVVAAMKEVDAPYMMDEDAMSEGKQSSTSWMGDLFRGSGADAATVSS